MTEPFVISLLAEGTETGKPATLAGGRIVVHTPRGLNPMDRLLTEAAAAVPASRIMTVLHPDAIVALALRALRPEAAVEFYHLDLFHVTRAARLARRHGFVDLAATCAPNLPRASEPPQLILLHVRRDDEAGLTLEMIRQAHAILAAGGKLLASINNPHDQWLRRQLEKTFGGLTIAARSKHGLVYLAKRGAGAAAPAAEQQFIRRVGVAWGGLVLDCETCYGVFNSGGLDEGSLALLEVMEAVPPAPRCSTPDATGRDGLLAAKKFEAARLLAVDSNSARSDGAAQRREAPAGPRRSAPRIRGDHFLTEEEWSAPTGSSRTRRTGRSCASRRCSRACATGSSGRPLWMVGKNNLRWLSWFTRCSATAQVHRRRGYMVADAIKK